ncbi:glycoside hydrolase superfamily [Phycomyces nitens]|nr:glycoside hydrolase superfamily [Phycomyces nitens]
MTKHASHPSFKLGQLFICGFDGLTPTKGILNLIQHHNLGAIILFSRNIGTPQQVQALTRALQEAARQANHTRPLLIAMDQENGVVRRLGHSGTYFPGNMALGAINNLEAAQTVASMVAEELLALGINWNLAPVLDVNNNPLNPVIGVRSYGEDSEMVGRLGMAQIEAYQRHGVATSAKHFPGHGDTATDSHIGVPVITKTLGELEELELKPFRKVVNAKGDQCPASVMVAHMSLPRLIKQPGQVSSLSPEIVGGLLRSRLGYGGVIITDCLEMEAVKETIGVAKGSLMALKAGNDMVMISHTLLYQEQALETIEKAFESKELDPKALEQSLERVASFKDRYLSWSKVLEKRCVDIVGSEKHVALSKSLYDKTPTVVLNRRGTIPLQPNQLYKKILFLGAQVPVTLAIDSEKEPFKAFEHSLKARFPEAECILFDESTPGLADKIKEADLVIVGTGNANLYPFQAKVVRLAHMFSKRLIVVAVMNPYDQTVFPDIDTFVVTFEYNPPALEAAVKLLVGEIETTNMMPVTLPRPSFDLTPYASSDLGAIWEMWNANFAALPLSCAMFKHVLDRMSDPVNFVCRDGNKIVGFVATQYIQATKDGQLALLMVLPEYKSRGIGTRLHDCALASLSQRGASHFRLGSTYPRFFPGVPEEEDVDGPKSQAFFRNRGWKLGSVVWDLMGDLENYETPKAIKERMIVEKVWFGRILPDQLEALIGFQEKYFPSWVSTYQHHARLGDFQDLIVGRQNDSQGPIIASLVVCTTNVSHPLRADLIWTDDRLFGATSGGMACVGVAKEARGRGIGLGIVGYANEVLKARGVNKSFVDWVEAVGFYRRTGYQTWRAHRICAL